MTDGTPNPDGLADRTQQAPGAALETAGDGMTLVPFDSIQACPKCGDESISRVYHKNGHCSDCPGRSSYVNCCKPESEHHLRICSGCGYRFGEMVMPA